MIHMHGMIGEIMPYHVFSEDEIIDSGEADINSRGAAYVAQKHIGKRVRWLIIKGDQPAT